MITHSYIVKWCFSDGSLMTSIIARFGANSCGAMLVQTSSMLVEFVQIGRFDCERHKSANSMYVALISKR